MHTYLTRDEFKAEGALGLTRTTDDTRLLELLQSVSAFVDNYTKRHFITFTGVRTFDPPLGRVRNVDLYVPDLIRVDSLKGDLGNTGTFGQTWATTDYLLYPLNADPTSSGNVHSMPYTIIRRHPRGTKSFPPGRSTIEVTGDWGYWEHLFREASVVKTGDWTASATSIDVDTIGTLQAGHTMLVEDEQIYITAVSSTTLTVRRGENGTTAASHVATTVIDTYEYPEPVKEAVLITAARLFKRRESSFANVIGGPDGTMSVIRGLDKDARNLLLAYRVGAGIKLIVPDDGRRNLSDLDVLRINETGGF